MKKTIIALTLLIGFVSCKKEEGFMFEAFHRYKSDHTRHCSDFFQYSQNNEEKALQFYLARESKWKAENPEEAALMIQTDSTWVKYHCTAEEWRKKNINTFPN